MFHFLENHLSREIDLKQFDDLPQIINTRNLVETFEMKYDLEKMGCSIIGTSI